MTYFIHLSITKKNAPQGVATVVDNIEKCLSKTGHEVIRESNVYNANYARKDSNSWFEKSKSYIISKFSALGIVYITYFFYRAMILIRNNEEYIFSASEIVCHDLFTLIVVDRLLKDNKDVKLSFFNHSDSNPLNTLKLGYSDFSSFFLFGFLENYFYKVKLDKVYSLSDEAGDNFCRDWGGGIVSKTVLNFSPQLKSVGEVRSTPKVWIIGSVCDRKRQLELFRRLDAFGLDRYSFEINILGYCEPDKLKELKSYAFVKYYGCVSSIEKYLSTSDIVLSVSDNEGLPMALIESLSLGAVILSTDVGGCNRLCIDGFNGYMISLELDVAEIVNKIDLILNNDELRKNLSNASRELYSKSFSPNCAIEFWNSQKELN